MTQYKNKIKNKMAQTWVLPLVCFVSLTAVPDTASAQEFAQAIIQYDAIDGLEYSTPNYTTKTITNNVTAAPLAEEEQIFEPSTTPQVETTDNAPAIAVQYDALAGLESTAPNYAATVVTENAPASVTTEVITPNSTVMENTDIVDSRSAVAVQYDALSDLENTPPNYAAGSIVTNVIADTTSQTMATTPALTKVEAATNNPPAIAVQYDALASLEKTPPNYIAQKAHETNTFMAPSYTKIAPSIMQTAPYQRTVATQNIEAEVAESVAELINDAALAESALTDHKHSRTSALVSQYGALTPSNSDIALIPPRIETTIGMSPNNRSNTYSFAPDLDTVMLSTLDAPVENGQTDDGALVASLKTKISLLEREKTALRDALTKRKSGTYEINMRHVEKRKAEKLSAGDKNKRPRFWPFPF